MSHEPRILDDARIRLTTVYIKDGTSKVEVIKRYQTVNTGNPLTDGILTALGGMGFNGAILLTGGTEVTRCGRKPPLKRSTFDPKDDLDAEVFVRWRVNAGRRNRWYMTVALEPDETYTARLISVVPSVGYELLGERANLVPDPDGISTINAIDALYVNAINTHLNGQIPFD